MKKFFGLNRNYTLNSTASQESFHSNYENAISDEFSRTNNILFQNVQDRK